MLRRIPRIICTSCGRARVTTRHGWHLCPVGRHRQTRGPAVLGLVGLIAAITCGDRIVLDGRHRWIANVIAGRPDVLLRRPRV